jgi:hypothetical protein
MRRLPLPRRPPPRTKRCHIKADGVSPQGEAPYFFVVLLRLIRQRVA